MAAKRAPAAKPTAKPKSRSNVDIMTAMRDKAAQQAKPENAAEDKVFDAYVYADLPGTLGRLRVYDDLQLAEIRRVEDLPDITITRTNSVDYILQFFGIKLDTGPAFPGLERVTPELMALIEDNMRSLVGPQVLATFAEGHSPLSRRNHGAPYAIGYDVAARNLLSTVKPRADELEISAIGDQLHLILRTPKLTVGNYNPYNYSIHGGNNMVAVTITVGKQLKFVELVSLESPAIHPRQLDPVELCAYIAERLRPLLEKLGYPAPCVEMEVPA